MCTAETSSAYPFAAQITVQEKTLGVSEMKRKFFTTIIFGSSCWRSLTKFYIAFVSIVHYRKGLATPLLQPAGVQRSQ